MSNVINLFTRETINLKPSLLEEHQGTWLEPIARLAMRFDTDLESVLMTPKIVTRGNALVVRTYNGNVHTGKMPDSQSMPFPYDLREYSKVLHQYDHLILEDECFMHMDMKYKLTLKFLKDLIAYTPKNLKTITIRTRSDLFAHDCYLDLLAELKQLGIRIKFNLYGMTISESTNKRKWPGAPSVKRRQRALDKAFDRLKLRLQVV
jgi:hypothetical protein